MTADERLQYVEKTLHEHMLENARVLAQIPLQLAAIKDGITDLRQDIKDVSETQERHSTRIMALEQAPLKAATAELAERKGAQREVVKTLSRKLLEIALQGLIGATVAIGAVAASAWAGLLKFAQGQ